MFSCCRHKVAIRDDDIVVSDADIYVFVVVTAAAVFIVIAEVAVAKNIHTR